MDAYKKAVLVGSEEEDKRWKAAEISVEQDVIRERQRAKPGGHFLWFQWLQSGASLLPDDHLDSH